MEARELAALAHTIMHEVNSGRALALLVAAYYYASTAVAAHAVESEAAGRGATAATPGARVRADEQLSAAVRGRHVQRGDPSAEDVLMLFTDRALFAAFDERLETRVNRPSKGPVVVAPTEPWESYGISAWTHVLRVSDAEDRMYYDCVEGSLRGPGRRICLAQSFDGGLSWIKPSLHVFSTLGSRIWG